MREGRVAVQRSGTKREGGASLVEFAFVIPLLTLFVFGIVQFGIAYDKQQSINSASREAARLGALASTTVNDMNLRAQETYKSSAAGGPDPVVTVRGGIVAKAGPPPVAASVSAPISPGQGPCGLAAPVYDYVRVEVTTPYDITIPFFGVMTVDIDSEAEFRCE